MRIVSLKKIVEERGIDLVRYKREVDGKKFWQDVEVGSDFYEDIKNWLIKGDFAIEREYRSLRWVLVVYKLDEDLGIKINPVKVKTEENFTEEESKMLNDLADEEYHAFVLHKPSNQTAHKKLKNRDIRAFANACIESLRRVEEGVSEKDFVIAKIDWDKQTISFESL